MHVTSLSLIHKTNLLSYIVSVYRSVSLRYHTCCLALRTAPPFASDVAQPGGEITTPTNGYVDVTANGSGSECSYTRPCASLPAAYSRSVIEQAEVIQIRSNADQSITEANATVTVLSSLGIIGGVKN